MNISILNKEVSYYPSVSDVTKGISVDLLKILESNKHRDIILRLRNEPDPLKQKAIKETLPCYTVSGIFKGREDEGLIKSSGLAAIDLDCAQDYDCLLLMKELQKIKYIAYTGFSCRGKRLFSIVSFLHPDMYIRHYEKLIRSFEDIGLPMGDDCHKKISQPRFVSYNTPDTCFYNHEAKAYPLLSDVKIYHYNKTISNTYSNSTGDTLERVLSCINQLLANNIDITNQYEDWLNIGFALADEFREEGRELFHKVSSIHIKYNQKTTDNKYNNILKTNNGKTSISTLFYYCKQYGIVPEITKIAHSNFKNGSFIEKQTIKKNHRQKKMEQRKEGCDIGDFILEQSKNEEPEREISKNRKRLVNMIEQNQAVQQLIYKLNLQLEE